MLTRIFAHRGSKGTHPENTLPAFEAAVIAMTDGIELDVHISKDGQLMVIHDETVDRTTTGSGLVMELTKKEIQSFDAGSWFSEEYAGTVVPTLEEVTYFLTYLNFKGMLNIEIKTDKIHYPELEKKVHDWMSSEMWPFEYMYSSFNPKTLALLNEIAPNKEKALILFDQADMIEYGLMTPYIDALHPKLTWLQKQDTLEGFPKYVRPWTANRKEKIIECLEKGVDAFMTDYPGKSFKIREKWQEQHEQ